LSFLKAVKMFRCHVVRGKLTAYIEGELPLKARRRVAAHLQQCVACQSAYRRQREFGRELERDLPRIGQPQAGQLTHIWARVQDDMQSAPPRRTFRYRASYGLGVLLLVVALLAPYILGREAAGNMPARTLPARTVALATETPDDRLSHRLPENIFLRTAPATVTRFRFTFLTPQAALTPAPRPRP
jgi:anti-sigma factor RsiW